MWSSGLGKTNIFERQWNKNKYVAYSSYGSHTTTHWQIEGRDNMISITFRQMSTFLIRSATTNQVTTQLSLRGWVDPFPDIIYI